MVVAFIGDIVATNVTGVLVAASDNDVLSNEMPVTAIEDTVTLHVAVFAPSVVVTVIVAVPIPVTETTPFVTVTTELLLDDHETPLFVALAGNTVAVNVTELLDAVRDNDV